MDRITSMDGLCFSVGNDGARYHTLGTKGLVFDFGGAYSLGSGISGQSEVFFFYYLGFFREDSWKQTLEALQGSLELRQRFCGYANGVKLAQTMSFQKFQMYIFLQRPYLCGVILRLFYHMVHCFSVPHCNVLSTRRRAIKRWQVGVNAAGAELLRLSHLSRFLLSMRQLHDRCRIEQAVIVIIDAVGVVWYCDSQHNDDEDNVGPWS
ncbi:hypothetical protein F4781DRAFT_278883 [Annulohypoxylon bovei var. microspora]|nr:hypothetical protein F4781DRAFT_278883 [Annulohypoxylon bovei var. microspora]